MTTTSKELSSTRPRRLPNRQIVQNFHLVWLDRSIDEENDNDCGNSITKLQQVVNTVNTFIDVDECIAFINDIKDEKVLMIFPGFLGQLIVPMLHDKPQVSAIFIYCGNQTRHEKWAQQWPKVKGVFTDITSICEALKQSAQDCEQNSVSISFVKSTDGTSTQNLDTLDMSFMYTQILKEILLTINFEQVHIDQFLTYCRTIFVDNTYERKNIVKIEKEYHQESPIWWYTFPSFLYSMLNRALRLMEVDRIIKMGFFVRDLHNHIATLHAEQYSKQNHSENFTLYRGQGLSNTDFEQLKKTSGGLLSFNNFLSTSQNRETSLEFARQTMLTSNLMGILFVMNIDPSISSTPFANVGDVSFYQKEEEEILLSMHSVFRIGQVTQLDENDRLWQVNLTLTSANDPQLHTLTERIREETKGWTGWLRLGKLMIKLGQFDKAEELYNILLKETFDEREKGLLFYQLGWIKHEQGKYKEAVELYEQSLEIDQKTLPPDHADLAASYNSIGLSYKQMGDYSKALSYYEKDLEISLKTLPENHSSLAISYNNNGMLYYNMEEYSKALSCYKKSFEIKQKNLPDNHPSFATTYNNIGMVYKKMGEYAKALSYYEKDLQISEKTLPADHPDFAYSYNNIGWLYRDMGNYSKALSYYERALNIKQLSLPPDHPDLVDIKESIIFVQKKLEETL